MFRRRFTRALLIGLAVAAFAAAPVQAGGLYYSEPVASTCTLSGGAYGNGFVRLRIYMQENGYSDTNYFKWKFKVWERATQTSQYYLIASKTKFSTTFPNDGQSYGGYAGYKYNFTYNEAHNYYHYMTATVSWWDARPGTDLKLEQAVWSSSEC